ncbi:MAG: glycosyltransferase family 4 protein [Planctomycetota bacterium]
MTISKTIPSKHIPVIVIGPTISGCGGKITGQAMMLQLLIDSFREKNRNVTVYDITEKRKSSNLRTYGSFTIARMLDYMKLIPAVWLKLFFSKKSVVYISIAPSNVGFVRDLFFIGSAFLNRHHVICHQLGGNYGDFYNKQSPFMQSFIRKILSIPKRIIVEGELVKEQFSFLKDNLDKIVCVPNGLPERNIEVAKEAKKYSPEKPFKLLYLSNLIETKGYWDVLEAVNILQKKQKNITCRFAGKFMTASDSVNYQDGEQAQKDFFEYIRKNGLHEYVSYAEGLLGQDKFEAFRESHVFLLPSNYVYEGQPVSILEAMSHGLVTIATKYRLIPSMVEDNHTGLFVPYGNPEAIAEKIEYLMTNRAEFERLSGNSIKRFCDYFSAECYIDRIDKVFVKATEKVD